MQKICTSSDSLRTKSRKFQPCSKVEFPALAPPRRNQVHSQKLLLLFLLFLLCCKKHLYSKLNRNYRLEMGNLAQLLGIHINRVISAALTRLRLASRPGFGAALPCMQKGEQRDARSAWLAWRSEWGWAHGPGGLAVPRCRAWLRNSREHKEKPSVE